MGVKLTTPNIFPKSGLLSTDRHNSQQYSCTSEQSFNMGLTWKSERQAPKNYQNICHVLTLTK
jgi:hypothetical protein